MKSKCFLHAPNSHRNFSSTHCHRRADSAGRQICESSDAWEGKREEWVMCTLRFGEILGRLVNLSGHDVNEILEEQNATHQRFGEIALSWGLCAPEDVWQAWCDQLLT